MGQANTTADYGSGPPRFRDMDGELDINDEELGELIHSLFGVPDPVPEAPGREAAIARTLEKLSAVQQLPPPSCWQRLWAAIKSFFEQLGHTPY